MEFAADHRAQTRWHQLDRANELLTSNQAAGADSKIRGPKPDGLTGYSKTSEGKALYRRRQLMIEPVFANANFTADHPLPPAWASRRPRRVAVDCSDNNLLKLYRAEIAPPGRLSRHPPHAAPQTYPRSLQQEIT